MMKKYFLLVLFFGLLLRLLFIGNTGFIADVAFWKSWSLAAADQGIVWASHNTNINYPPGFLYVLWFMGKLYTLVGNPHDYNLYWKDNNFAFLLVSKSIAIAADIAIACLIFWFVSQKEKLNKLGAGFAGDKSGGPPIRAAANTWSEHEMGVASGRTRKLYWITNNLPLVLSSVFFLNPVVILDSALWGQVESFGLLFTLAAIILLFYRHPLPATAIFTVGCLMKLQNIIYIPIYFLFILRYFDIKTLVKSLSAGAFAFFLVTLPFLLQNDLKQVLYLMTVNSDFFPWLSLNAHNLWWVKAAAQGMKITDRITTLGILNAKTVGLMLFSSSYLLSSILVYRKPSPRNLLLSLTVAIYGFFLFTTQSHERYSYPVIVLLLFLYPFVKQQEVPQEGKVSRVPQVENSRDTRGAFDTRGALICNYFWILYFLLTCTIFFNVHTGLILNYPYNGFTTLTRLTTLPLTILNSYFLILLFILLLPLVFSQISYLYLVLCSLFFVLCIIILQLPYFTTGRVSLTFFKPIVTQQDYGVLKVNKSVNSDSWKTWNRLSNNYFFYRKGFGTHANSYLVFDIDRKFGRFSTDFGIDTEAGTQATAVFKIYGDGKLLFESGKMGRFDFPAHAQVDVAGVKKLELAVNDAGDGINNDHADWLNPVLYK